MAFSTGIGDRSGLRSPREDSFASLGLTSPLRSSVGTQFGSGPGHDVRGQLQRRFTTNNIPTLNTPLSPIGQQRRQAAEPPEFTTAVRSSHVFPRRIHKLQRLAFQVTVVKLLSLRRAPGAVLLLQPKVKVNENPR